MTEVRPRNRSLSFPALALLAGAAVALISGAFIGIDLYHGLVDGEFRLVRGNPITSADGFRYGFTAFGETLSVVILAGCTGLMLKLFSLVRKMKESG